MKQLRLWISLGLMVCIVALGSSFALASQKEQVLKVGKKGEVMFETDTAIGALTLPHGTFTMQHRVEGQEHFVKFVPVRGSGQPTEVKCRMEPLNRTADKTSVFLLVRPDGTRGIQKVHIRGENVAHIFE